MQDRGRWYNAPRHLSRGPVSEANENIGIPLFSVVEDEIDTVAPAAEVNDFQWTKEDASGLVIDSINQEEDNELLDFSKDDEEDDDISVDQIPEEETEEMKEIPPAEQNPDVIKMREMNLFGFLNQYSTIALG